MTRNLTLEKWNGQRAGKKQKLANMIFHVHSTALLKFHTHSTFSCYNKSRRLQQTQVQPNTSKLHDVLAKPAKVQASHVLTPQNDASQPTIHWTIDSNSASCTSRWAARHEPVPPLSPRPWACWPPCAPSAPQWAQSSPAWGRRWLLRPGASAPAC